ncbi:MAG: TIM barrel protein [Patescibacteria group bacterium]
MKIGISTAVSTGKDNWDRMIDLINHDFKNIQLYNKITRIRFADIEPLLILKNKQKLTYSFHSMVQDLFCSDKVIADGEFYLLKEEIRIASLLKCPEIIFHISKKIPLSVKEKNSLNQLINFAIKNNIILCLENNSSTSPFSGDYLIDFLNEYKNLFFCLDIGHFNIALKKGLVSNFDNFLEKVKNKIIQLHLNYNDGVKDQHIDFSNKGYRYLHKILQFIDQKDFVAFIETKNIKQALKIKKYF